VYRARTRAYEQRRRHLAFALSENNPARERPVCRPVAGAEYFMDVVKPLNVAGAIIVVQVCVLFIVTLGVMLSPNIVGRRQLKKAQHETFAASIGQTFKRQ
jgi:hypothetical protein